jgi:hypothetical protein
MGRDYQRDVQTLPESLATITGIRSLTHHWSDLEGLGAI